MKESLQVEPQEKTVRIVDLKVPLPWMLSGLGVVMWGLITMYFTLSQLVTTVSDLQTTVKSGNTSVQVLSSETALLKFRIGSVESDMVRLNELARAQQFRPVK